MVGELKSFAVLFQRKLRIWELHSPRYGHQVGRSTPLITSLIATLAPKLVFLPFPIESMLVNISVASDWRGCILPLLVF